MSIDFRNEAEEALDAAEEALDCLYDAKDCLDSAKNWGVFDILAGGIVSTMVKRKKMADAKKLMVAAADSLEKLQDELDDIDDVIDMNLNMDDFLSFADYFFDNFITDVMVQQRINDARSRIRRIIEDVEYIRDDLRNRLGLDD
ncbi:MAG: hypothetical protein IK151_03500 [Erysipelotrichaceae bacterium]|nr:hypothetical protein [Erysipelotrichaceae bacterium]